MNIVDLETAHKQGLQGFQLRNCAKHLRDELLPKATGKRKDELFRAIHELRMVADALDMTEKKGQ